MKINELKIYCSNLSEQTNFYSQIIGLELLEQSDSGVTLRVGNSNLKLVKSNKFQPYHFAINIPCNKENEAIKWLKERVDILKDGNNESQAFDLWNANAIYFYDIDKKIGFQLEIKHILQNLQLIFP